MVATADMAAVTNHDRLSRIWHLGLAGSDAAENAASVALDNIDGMGEVSMNFGRIPN